MLARKTPAPFYERLALVLIGIVTLSYLIILGKEILDPLMFGFLFAILLLPVSSILEKKLRFPRSLSSFVSILLFIFFVVGVVYLVSTQISGLAKDWPLLKQQITQSANDVQHWVQRVFHVNMEKQRDYVNSTTDELMSSGAAVVGQTFLSVSSLLLFFAMISIFTFFILFYRRLLFRFVIYVFREENVKVVTDIAENIQTILRQYILGLLVEMVIVSTISCIVFLIIGVKYAILLGIITGLFNIIPYVGIFSALLLSSLITFATGAVGHALIVAGCVIGIHALDANILLPLVVGSKVRLNALITFLGIILGEMLWGLSGMFLSIPVIAMLKIIFDRIEELRPWGYLLGGDYEYKTSAQKEMKTE